MRTNTELSANYARRKLQRSKVFTTTLRCRHTVYDRIDAVATINFSTQFGAATIREWRLFESGVYVVRRGTGSKKSEHKHKDSVLV